ncbi:MAG: thiolase family protein [Lautropia sp.]
MGDRDAHLVGVGMTKFGKALDRTLGQLVEEATRKALDDARIEPGSVECIFSSNSVAGLITGQESVRGQVALKGTGISGCPVFNVDNACASGSTALHMARCYVAAGYADVALVVGFEKMYHPDKAQTLKALESATDVAEVAELRERMGADSGSRSIFMDFYASKVRGYLERTGAPPRVLAQIAAKNHGNGALNPLAQYRTAHDVEAVLASRPIVSPLTLLMCSPFSDGAAALVVASSRWCRLNGGQGPRLLGSGVASESFAAEQSQMAALARRVYEQAGIRPADIDVMEVHDAAAPGELFAYEDMGLAEPGAGWRLVEEGAVHLGGRVPVNPSGGLMARGHPIGATGVAQVCELVWQLRGTAGERQVKGARIGVAHNRGGQITTKPTTGSAAMSVTVLAA